MNSNLQNKLDFDKRRVIKQGQRIRKLRIERGLSQSELSDTAGIGKNILGMIERAETNPKLTTLINIANRLEIRRIV